MMYLCILKMIMMTDNICDCIVVGGGISGIAYAHLLQATKMKVVILEAQSRVGGRIHTGYFPQSALWFEMGAHTCYRSYASLLSIVESLGLTDLICPVAHHSFKTSENGKVYGLMHGLSFLPLLFHGFRLFKADKTGKTVREYFEPIVGKRNYEHFFSKTFRAVLSQPAENYPAELFLKKRNTKREEYPTSYTFKHGLSNLLNEIINKSKLTVHTEAAVTYISCVDGLFRVQTTSGAVYKAGSIALAVSPKATAALLRDIEPEVAALLQTIPMSQSETLSVVVPAKALKIPKMAGLIPLNDDFLSSVTADLTPQNEYRCFSFHFAKGSTPPDRQISIACNAMGIKPTDIVETQTTIHALPSLRVPHITMAEQIAQKKRHPNIKILGNYFGGVSIEDCVIRAKAVANEDVSNAPQ